VFVAVTVTPGISALVGSETVPLIALFCAKRLVLKSRQNMMDAPAAIMNFEKLMFPPLI
jgi:hypothetical protein